MRDVCFERVIFGDCGTGPNEIICEEKEIILRPDRGLNIPCLLRGGGGGGSSRVPEFLFINFCPLGQTVRFYHYLCFVYDLRHIL